MEKNYNVNNSFTNSNVFDQLSFEYTNDNDEHKKEIFNSRLNNNNDDLKMENDIPVVGDGPEIVVRKDKKISKKSVIALILYAFVLLAVVTAIICSVVSKRTQGTAYAGPTIVDDTAIGVMADIDDDTQNDKNWFDRICDSLS